MGIIVNENEKREIVQGIDLESYYVNVDDIKYEKSFDGYSVSANFNVYASVDFRIMNRRPIMSERINGVPISDENIFKNVYDTYKHSRPNATFIDDFNVYTTPEDNI